MKPPIPIPILLFVMMRITVTTAAAANEPTAKPAHLLFTGSSSMYFHDMPKQLARWLTEHGDMPATAEIVGRSGDGIHVYLRPDFNRYEYGVKPGQSFMQKLDEGGNDFVVLMAVARFMVNEDGQEHAAAMDTYCKAIRESGAEPVIYEMGWGRTDAEQTGRERIFAAAVRNKVTRVAPCSSAWARVRAERPDLELHNPPDLGHPGSLGTYLNLCCFYAAFTGRSPVGLPVRTISYWPHLSEEEKEAAKQKVERTEIDDPYYNALAKWMKARSIVSKTAEIDDATAKYLQTVAWQTYQQYQQRLGEAAK